MPLGTSKEKKLHNNAKKYGCTIFVSNHAVNYFKKMTHFRSRAQLSGRVSSWLTPPCFIHHRVFTLEKLVPANFKQFSFHQTCNQLCKYQTLAHYFYFFFWCFSIKRDMMSNSTEQNWTTADSSFGTSTTWWQHITVLSRRSLSSVSVWIYYFSYV